MHHFKQLSSKAISRSRRAHVLAFIIPESVIYTTYLLLDLCFSYTLILADFLKYAGIIGCFIYTQYICAQMPPKKRHYCLSICAFLILFADYCLLFTDQYLTGLLIFLAVQLLYALVQQSAKKLVHFLTACAFAALPAMLFLRPVSRADPALIAAAAFYIVILAANTTRAFSLYFKKHSPDRLLFALGLLLYSLCDLNVGLANSAHFLTSQAPVCLHMLAAPAVRAIATGAMWFFYLPAQVLIALSIPAEKDAALPKAHTQILPGQTSGQY